MKKKIYVVPHTHWDREWMFSEQTGNVLLNQTINEMLETAKKQKDFKMVLDGQVSLLDDYLNWNESSRKEKIKAIKESGIALGPWFSQPDVFSSLGETTIRNLEVAKKTLEELGLETIDTAYMPDTFGFNQNLPQILKQNGMKNFVHWRGLNREHIKNFPLYNWEGVDGTKILSSNYKTGYYFFGTYYPYSGVTEDNIHTLAKEFFEKTKTGIEESFKLQKNKTSALFPLGGDQAPAIHGAKRFFEVLNEIQGEYEFIITSNFNDFFNEHRGDEVVDNRGNLKTPIAGKIHRTISSARYDIKSLFRRCENDLYYKLEPLELIYKNIDASYDFEEYKNTTIIKPLLKLQAHDSLGGCNTDVTNDDVIAKLKQVHRRIVSTIDLITYKILQFEGENESPNAISVINQAPFENRIVKTMVIYSKKPKINIENNFIKIITLESKCIGFNKDAYEIKVLLISKKMNSFSRSTASLVEEKQRRWTSSSSQMVSLDDKYIAINDGKTTKKVFFDACIDEGDNYDFSASEKQTVTFQKHSLISQKTFGDVTIAKVRTSLVVNYKRIMIETEFVAYDNKVDIEITAENKFVGYRLSLKFIGTDDIAKSQHLVITDFDNLDETKDWKKDMVEYPAIVDHNDGVVQMRGEGGYNIYTKGNNEIFKTDDGVEIILYRTNELVSREKLNWRPGIASGIPYAEETVGSQLLKKLTFKFRIDEQNPIKGLNEWNFSPIIHYKNDVHLTAHVHNKFKINDIEWPQDKKITFPEVDHEKLYISSLRLVGDEQVSLRVSNMFDDELKTKIKINGKTKEYHFKSYEYKTI